MAFKQPPGKPSLVSAFIHSLKLSQILSQAMRTIVRKVWFITILIHFRWSHQYASTKARKHFSLTGPAWAERVIASFDSTVNEWAGSIPDHRPCASASTAVLHLTAYPVRWDPHREHEIFFRQSAQLYAQYHNLRIFIHRPFIGLQNPSPSAFPSAAICANAARACSHAVEATCKRLGARMTFFFEVC